MKNLVHHDFLNFSRKRSHGIKNKIWEKGVQKKPMSSRWQMAYKIKIPKTTDVFR